MQVGAPRDERRVLYRATICQPLQAKAEMIRLDYQQQR